MPQKNVVQYTNHQIIDALVRTNFVKQKACKLLGMSKQALYYRLERDETLQRQLALALDDRLDIAEGELMKLVKGGNFQAIKFFLETIGRKRGYGQKVEVAHTKGNSQEILEALMRKYAKEESTTPKTVVIDAEFSEEDLKHEDDPYNLKEL